MSYNRYIPISKERYDILIKRYDEYVKVVDYKTRDPIRVFDPLNPKILEELDLIREVSKELQKKKEEDMKKAHAADSAEAEDVFIEKDSISKITTPEN